MSNVKIAQDQQLRSGLRVHLLGPIKIVGDGKPVVIASKKARAMLGYLALREGVEVSRGLLGGLLWGERSENQARASLRQTLSEVRAALAGSRQHPLMATKEAITWTPGTAWVDAIVMASVASSQDEDTLNEAAALIGGELMEGLAVGEPAFEQWLAGERERFRLLTSSIHGRLMDLAERDGRLEAALTSGLKVLKFCVALTTRIVRSEG